MSALPKSPLGTPPPNLNVTSTPQMAVVPGGFWRRFAATIIDGVVMSIAQFPLKFAVILVLGGEAVAGAINLLVSLLFAYNYYGYFYSKKGATPGKMVMGLRLLDDQTGTHLSYGAAFKREIVKGLFGFVTLGVSYFMAGFREDKKSLHDIYLKTRVVRVVK
jgi:uncharacterized RDD family membrane protein YckC